MEGRRLAASVHGVAAVASRTPRAHRPARHTPHLAGEGPLRAAHTGRPWRKLRKRGCLLLGGVAMWRMAYGSRAVGGLTALQTAIRALPSDSCRHPGAGGRWNTATGTHLSPGVITDDRRGQFPGPAPDHSAGPQGLRQPEHPNHWCPRAGQPGELSVLGEDEPFRPRAHPRAGGACPRHLGLRLLRGLRQVG